MASDLDTLLDMGFEKARAEIAVKKSGGRKFERHIKNALANPSQCRVLSSGSRTIRTSPSKRFKLLLLPMRRMKMKMRRQPRSRSWSLVRQSLSYATNAARSSETRTWLAITLPRRKFHVERHVGTYSNKVLAITPTFPSQQTRSLP